MRKKLKFVEIIPYEPEKFDAQNQNGLVKMKYIPTPVLFSCIKMWKLWRKKRLGYNVVATMKSMQREFMISKNEESGKKVEITRKIDWIFEKFFSVYEVCIRRILTYK